MVMLCQTASALTAELTIMRVPMPLRYELITALDAEELTLSLSRNVLSIHCTHFSCHLYSDNRLDHDTRYIENLERQLAQAQEALRKVSRLWQSY